MNIVSCNTHQHSKTQVLFIITHIPNFQKELLDPHTYPPSHRLGASKALLELFYPVKWPQLIEPEIVNQAWLPRLLLLGIWNWTSNSRVEAGHLMEVIQTQEHPVKKDLPPCAWRKGRRGSEERGKE